MALNTQEIWGIKLFSGGKAAVLERLARGEDKGLTWVATVNPEFVMKSQKDKEFKQILQETDLNVVDGIALVWAREVDKRCPKGQLASRLGSGLTIGRQVLQGKYHQEVVAGSSLMDDLAKMAKAKGWGIFYLGGWDKRAEKTAAFFEERYPGLKVAWSGGEPEVEKEETLRLIAESKTKILFVAYGMGKQERWIKANRKELEKAGVQIVMGVGRSFDYYSGALKRAPEKWQKMGLEWLYSLIREPKRWRRQLVLPQFVWRVLVSTEG